MEQLPRVGDGQQVAALGGGGVGAGAFQQAILDYGVDDGPVQGTEYRLTWFRLDPNRPAEFQLAARSRKSIQH